jgi:acyl-homoserine lactone acylase PvdQ
MMQLALAVLAAVAIESPPTQPAPPPGKVTIVRDVWGVPHVYATRLEDGYYGVGYAIAADDLNGILTNYLAIQGRSAEVVGKNALAMDSIARQTQIMEASRSAFDRLPPQLRAVMTAYVAGVRRYITDHPDEAPAWTPSIEPHFPIAVYHLQNVVIALTQRGQGLADCIAGGKVSRDAAFARELLALADRRELDASNAMVLMPQRTVMQAAMLDADSHSPFATFRDEVRLHAADMHVSGIVIAGTPFVLIGNTAHVAWGFTVGGPDTSDCYEVAVDPQDAGRYRFDERWRRFGAEDVDITVKDQGKVSRRFEFTDHNGVRSLVIGRTAGHAYVLSSPYLELAAEVALQVFEMNRATSVQTLRDALDRQALFPENVMAADTAGRAYYVSTGRTPIRARGFDWSKPVPGNGRRTSWRGFHGPRDAVEILNPASGYMQNNNIAPDMMMADSPLTADRYPAYVYNIAAGKTNERGRRAIELLSRAKNASYEDFLAIAMDETWISVPLWQAALEVSTATRASEIVTSILEFNGVASRDSVAALHYAAWLRNIQRVGAARSIDVQALVGRVLSGGVLEAPDKDLLRAAAEQSEADLVQAYGGLATTYGATHRIGRGHADLALGGGAVRVGNWSERTLRAMDCGEDQWSPTTACRVVSGQRHPMITILTEPIRSYSGVPFGQASSARSAHFMDQAMLASERRLKPAYFEWSELVAHVVTALTLETSL